MLRKKKYIVALVVTSIVINLQSAITRQAWRPIQEKVRNTVVQIFVQKGMRGQN